MHLSWQDLAACRLHTTPMPTQASSYATRSILSIMALRHKEGQISRPLKTRMGRTLATPRVRPSHSQPAVTDRRLALASQAKGNLATSLSNSNTHICRTIKARCMCLPIILQELTLCMLDLLPMSLSTSTIQTC